MPNVNIDLDQDEYERLGDLKDTHGLTWRGLLLQGAKNLTEDPLVVSPDIKYRPEGVWEMGIKKTGEKFITTDGRDFNRVDGGAEDVLERISDSPDKYRAMAYDGVGLDPDGDFAIVLPDVGAGFGDFLLYERDNCPIEVEEVEPRKQAEDFNELVEHTAQDAREHMEVYDEEDAIRYAVREAALHIPLSNNNFEGWDTDELEEELEHRVKERLQEEECTEP